MSRQPKSKATPAAAAAPEPQAAPAVATPDPAEHHLPQVTPDSTGAAVAAAAPVDPNLPTGPGASPDASPDPDGNPPSTEAPGQEPVRVSAVPIDTDPALVAEVTLTDTVDHDGVVLLAGTILTLPVAEAEILMRAGVATRAPEADPAGEAQA